MAQSICPSAILLPSRIGRFQTGAAGALQVESRCLRGETRSEYRLARQVPLARVLHHRAGGDIVEALSLQPEALHHAAQRRRQHLLIAHLRVGAAAAYEGNAYAPDDCDAPWLCSD
jgi:hypothetical protein